MTSKYLGSKVIYNIIHNNKNTAFKYLWLEFLDCFTRKIKYIFLSYNNTVDGIGLTPDHEGSKVTYICSPDQLPIAEFTNTFYIEV